MLVEALTLQIGNLVSYNELSQLLKVNNETVIRYIEILEKSFLIFRIPSFQINMRNELAKSRKNFFYDLGVRNAIINNFLPIDRKSDLGAIWDNFLIAERITLNSYNKIDTNYFCRNHQKQEIDFLKENGNGFKVFEITFNQTKKNRIPKTFLDNYPSVQTFIIVKKNFNYFLGIE